MPYLPTGTVVGGSYEILRPLSQGGMGAVYAAVQVTTKKERALKVMRADLLSSPKMRERFVQEAQIGARIESEHVVEVIDAGVDQESGTPWLAMELLRGRTLSALIEEQGPLGADVVAELFGQLCHALGAAHDVGIVHRDLKPDNLFLADTKREGGGFTLKVLDFGIAKLVSEAGTRSTGALGTPLFMPPEQMVPGATITPAADVWALGLIAFFMLGGRHYWLAGNQPDSSAMMLLNEVNQLPIEPASRRLAALEVGVALPAGFDEWFGACVNRVVEFRYRNAREARAAFTAMLRGEPLPARAPQLTPARDDRPSAVAARTSEVERTIAAAPFVDPAFEETVLHASSTGAGPQTQAPRRKPASGLGRWVALGLLPLLGAGAIYSLRGRPSDPPPATAPPAAPSHASSGSEPAADADSLMIDQLLKLSELDPQAAHERLFTLPAGSPARSGPGAKKILTRWIDSVFAEAERPGPLRGRRERLSELLADPLVEDAVLRRALDALEKLEPREIGLQTRHYLVIEVRGKGGAPLDGAIRELGRAALLNELSSRVDVAVAAPDATRADVEAATRGRSVQRALLEIGLAEPIYAEGGLRQNAELAWSFEPNRARRGSTSTGLTSPKQTQKSPSRERELTLLAGQKLARDFLGSLADAGTALPSKNGPTCACAPGDPLCSCP